MASLKEVKNRIISVGSMKKITLARQMISSTQLHHAQGVLEKTIVYKEALDRLIAGLLIDDEKSKSPLMQIQPTGMVAIVIMSSNTGMCGAFNANMIKRLDRIRVDFPEEKLILFPIGKKIRKAVEDAGYVTGYNVGQDADHLADKTAYHESNEMAMHLMELYLSKKIKQVELIYYHFRNMVVHEIKEMTLLPYSIPSSLPVRKTEADEDFIFEPSKGEILESLLSMVIKSNFYYALAENKTSEHAARTMAMQLATENADKLLSELQLTKNKLRQQNITSELLDIIGSSFA